MKVLLLLYLGIGISSCTTIKAKKHSFSITIGSGFHKDTLSVAYNGIPLIINSVADSDFVTGIVPSLSIVGEKGVLKVNSQKGERSINAQLDNESAILVVRVGQYTSSIPFNSRKGRYLLINYAQNGIQLNQYKKPMVFY
ncbi:hypothetical protein EXU85_16860 [Spirosoma sp. KCTC 42546]|uniref:hypothetical protein n=1 Tax=Spirosoma sp. KCTC 42546 TaxID=2520506 RepID=UPI001156E53E|nr:hypothetical protein [Spirosoma sp. KCTC 42546]QDK80183.1 hypothetical protein EXU85_16860 [Spirosoma sp. KCTC 42546]